MSAVWLILIFAQAQKVLNAQIVAATSEREQILRAMNEATATAAAANKKMQFDVVEKKNAWQRLCTCLVIMRMMHPSSSWQPL